jgi:membrane dipeptidase
VQFHGLDIPIVDTHADSLGGVLRGERHLYERADSGQVDFPRLGEVGHTLQFFSLWVEPEYKPERALWRTLQYVDAFWEETRAAGINAVRPVLDASDLTQAQHRRVPGAAISIEGAEALGSDPAMVRIMHRLGVRLMSLTWNQRNALADGSGEDPGGGGISRAGREIVREMNRVGIVVDISHLSEAGFWDVLEVSDKPIIASHSNCRTLAPHRRNLTDHQIRALAAHGGVQGITFVRDFLGGVEDIGRVADHIVHALDLVGSDRHTALGSDFDGVETPVAGLEDVTRLPDLAELLSRRGLVDETIGRIFGYNYLEFFGQAWR